MLPKNGVEKDFVKAKGWFTQAAEQGNLEAHTILLDLFDEALLKDKSE